MAERFALLTLFLLIARGSPIQKSYVDVFEETLRVIEVDKDFTNILREITKQCQCKEKACRCCDSTLVFGNAIDVCLMVRHAQRMFMLKLEVSGKQVWDDEVKESSVKELIGKSHTVKIAVKIGNVSGSGDLTFHNIQMTPENIASSCVDGKAVVESNGLSESVKVTLGCFTV